MDNRKFGAFSSSEDPQKLGDTVKALILGASTTIIWLVDTACSWLNKCYSITSSDITDFAVGVGIAITSLWTLFGLIKKVVVRVTQK